MPWAPVRTFNETEAILCAPGRLHEVEDILLNGRVQKVYKNLWPSVRSFWLSCVAEYADTAYIVFENQRFTYNQTHSRAVKAAAVFRLIYNIQKGDRVGICSRNCPDYLVAFWAAHLLGAVPVLINAWLPTGPSKQCILQTNCSMVILDSERVEKLAPAIPDITKKLPRTKFLAFDDESQGLSIPSFSTIIASYDGEIASILDIDPFVVPEDNALIIFTSGTTGMPKGVLSTQRQVLTNIPNVMVSRLRAFLREGDEYPSFQQDIPQKGILISVPLFHVTGLTSFALMATAMGMKIVLMTKWVVEDAARLTRRENVRVAGGVPTMVSDLIHSSLAEYALEGLLFGGSPAPDTLVPKGRKAFPTALMLQAYGMTETNGVAVSIAGEDYAARPTSTGRVSPVNEVKIVVEGRSVSCRTDGEVWLRGPNIMQCYWGDPEATAKVVTPDGWLRTGDLGYLDEEGFLYIKDRIKDIIIRGGENIDSVSVENALYRDPRVLEAAAVGVPDDRLGELVAAVVSVRPGGRDSVTGATLIAMARQYLPRYAVPVMVIVLDEPFEHTPSGKIMKSRLRQLARHHWVARARNSKAGDNPAPNL